MNLSNFLNRAFGKIEKLFSGNRLRLLKTIYVNFRLLPLHDAIKIPIYIYGRTKLNCLNGRVEFCGTNVTSGMIKLGRLDNVYSTPRRSTIFLASNSILRFNGKFVASNGYLFHLKDNALLDFGKYVTLGDNVSIICANKIVIGNYTQITFNCYIVDSNFHYTIDLNSKEIKRREGMVLLGERNWIGNSSYIAKGTITGSGFIIGTGSFVNKSFNGVNDAMIIGRPAEIKKTGYTRILSFAREREIELRFKETDEERLLYEKSYIDPYDDIEQFFV